MSDVQDIFLRNIQIYIKSYKDSLKEKSNVGFKKYRLYELYSKYYNSKLDVLSKDSKYRKINYLIGELQDCNTKLYQSNLKVDRINQEVRLDILRSKMEKLVNVHIPTKDSEYIYYPSIEDKDFNQKIYSKKEFNKLKIPLTKSIEEIQKKRLRGFSLSFPQRFAKGFISEYTPYNGILLWHQVGVGKTCTGISIAENFKEFLNANNKKILILTPSDTLQQNWRDEIFNIEKELNKKENKKSESVQCTGNTYSKLYPNLSSDNIDNIKKKMKNHINQYYEFMGYQKLARSIQKETKDLLSSRKINKQRTLIQYIKNRFSNRVIIMDEVHFTRDSGGTKDKLAQPYIELIARYSENTKIILATATPMYNIPREIVWLINILLWNDNKSPLIENELFDKDGIELIEDTDSNGNIIVGQTTNAENKIIDKSRGYISHVRGENPFTFPIKLYPRNGYTPKPTHEIINSKYVRLDQDKLIKNMLFYKNMVDEWQYNHIKKYTTEASGKDDDIEESTAFSSKVTQASNFVFPLLGGDGDFIGEIGDSGFNECLGINDNKKYFIQDYLTNINGSNKSFLHLDNIGQFSKKCENIIKSSLTNRGIGFIFSQYINSGVKIMALALEENGFSRYIGDGKIDNLLTKDKKRDLFCAKHLKYYSELDAKTEKPFFCPAKYILLDGQISKDLLNKLVKESRGEGKDPNINGEHIKIILGSKVVEQGISLHRVREIHIMDPWYHFNQMEQSAGRAIRNFSHIKLPDFKDRNVTLYLHIAALPKKMYKKKRNPRRNETSDERIYRKAYIKRLSMAKIERILKKNAIDCGLNIYGNLYLKKFYEEGQDPLGKKAIRDSKGNIDTIDLYDKDGSYNCDFKKCTYKCYTEGNNERDFVDKINNATFNNFFAEDDIQLIIEYIKELFREDFAYLEADIINNIKLIDPNISDEYIYTAISRIIENNEIIYDINKRPGNLIDIEGIYLFQPLEIDNKNIPMLYRYLPNYYKKTKVRIEKSKKRANKRLKLVTKSITKKPKQKKKSIIKNDIIIDKLREFYVKSIPMIKIELNKNKITKYLNFDIDTRENILAKLMFISYLEKNFTNKERSIILFEIIQEKVKSSYRVNIPEDLKELLLLYYDRSSLTKFILRKSDINPKEKSDEIVGYRFIEEGNVVIYLADSNNDLKKVNNLNFTDLIYNTSVIPDNDNTIYGFMETKRKKSGSADTQFNIINKNDPAYSSKKILNIDKSKNKKLERTGAICGQAKGAKNIPELISIIEYLVRLIQENMEIFKSLEKSVKSKTLESINLINKKKYDELYGNFTKSELSKISIKKNKTILCAEIELLLRYCDLYMSSVNNNYRFFYTYEERLILNM